MILINYFTFLFIYRFLMFSRLSVSKVDLFSFSILLCRSIPSRQVFRIRILFKYTPSRKLILKLDKNYFLEWEVLDLWKCCSKSSLYPSWQLACFSPTQVLDSYVTGIEVSSPRIQAAHIYVKPQLSYFQGCQLAAGVWFVGIQHSILSDPVQGSSTSRFISRQWYSHNWYSLHFVVILYILS